jgi:hypothetical protein
MERMTIPEDSHEETIPDVEAIKLEVNNIFKKREAREEAKDKEKEAKKINPVYDPKQKKPNRKNKNIARKEDLTEDVPYEFHHDYTKINQKEIERYESESMSQLSSLMNDSFENLILDDKKLGFN